MLAYHLEGDFVVLISAGSRVQASEVRGVLKAAAEDPRINGSGLLLVDTRQSTARPTLDEIRKNFSYFKVLSGRIRPFAAIVVCPVNSHLVGKMYQLEARMRAGLRVEIFTEPAKARAWLEACASPPPIQV